MDALPGQAFEEFTHVTEPVERAQARESVLHMISDAGGALAVFLARGQQCSCGSR